MKQRNIIFSLGILLLLTLSSKGWSQYCIPSSTNGPLFEIHIDGVQINNLDNLNTGDGAGTNYDDYTSMFGEINIASQNELIVTATSGTNFSNTYYHAWIDFNRDNDFYDAGEYLGGILPLLAGEELSFNFTAPSGAQDGPARLRVTGAWGTSTLDPCATYGYGETEDYTVALTGFEVIDSFENGNFEPTNATWVDINNDGFLDVVYTSSWQIDIKQNNGDGTFTIIHTGFRPPVFGSIVPGDYNRDNYVDLLVTGKRAAYASEYLSYVLKNTGGSFVDINANLEELTESSGDWGDFDNDGDLDILLTGLGALDPVAKIYENVGNDEFIEYPVFFKGISNGDCQWIDFNNDSYLDVIVSGLNIDGNSDISIYENMNGESFSELNFPFLNIMGVFDIGDYDEDGDQDIIITGEENREPWVSGTPITALYRNNGDGTFSLIETGIKNLREADVKFGDADNDGDLDIFVSGRNVFIVDQYLRVYYNEGGDIFTYKDLDNMSTVYLPDLELGDFDNDSDLDFLYVGHDQTLRIVENHTALPNIAPSPPSWYFSEMMGNGINLFWGLGYDNETQRPGLSYNLKVGSSSGGYDIVGPGSDHVTGKMKFRNSGYLNHDSTVLISGLPIGTYYWSVQSVDNNYSGSAFGPEQTIEVKEPFTEISPGFPQVASGRSLWCDFNSDGNKDLILSGSLSSGASTTIWYNNTGDSFTAYANNALLEDVKNSTVSLYDYDGDNDIDLMYYGLDAGNSTVSKFYENLGASFSEIAMPHFTASGAEWGDVDNDGDADFIGRNSVLENDGMNNFSYLATVSGYNLKAFDADNDGDLDIFSPQYGKIHFNDGTGAFIESTYTLGPLEAFTSDIGDYNNDGYLDILISGRATSTRVSFVFRNNGDGTFTDINANIRAIESGRVSWVDYENDGDLDVSMAGASSTNITRVFINMGDDLFSEIPVNLPENYDQDIDWADYDNDGDMDLIYMGRIGTPRLCNIYKNNNNFQNQKPTTPGGLDASVEGKKATLSWYRADTIETMSYNVRIGTSPGAYDILAPQSHLVTGKPFLQILGNAQMNNFKIIENLEVGTYYWSVEALDKNFVNSSWSTESSFSVNVLQADFNAADVCDGETMTFSDVSLTSGVSIDTWLYDFGDGNTSASQNPSHVYANSGTYTVVLTINSGVYEDSTSQVVVVNKNPIPNFSSTIACQGIEPGITNTTDLNSLTLSSWHWDFGNSNTSSAQTPVNPGLLIAGDYEVKLTATTAENGCVDSISKTVTVSPYPETAISANGPLAFCGGDSVILSVAKNLAYDYYWKESGVNIAGQDSSVFYAKQTGDYTVEVVNPNGNCSKTSNEAYVYVPPSPASPTISSSGPVVFCNGDSVILSVTDNSDHAYFWKRNGGAVGIDSSIFIAKAGGNYSLLIENSQGCTAASFNTITVTVLERPATPTVGVNGQTAFCEGQSVILSVANDPLMSYQWMDGVVDVGGAVTSTYTASTTGDYKLKITSGDGCEVETQVVEVIADPAPSRPTIAYTGDTEFCDNESLILSVADNPNYSYEWKLNGGTVGTDSSKHIANAAGDYTVEVQNLGDCSVTSVNTVTLTVYESPASPTLNLSGATTFCDDASLTLTISDPGTDSYQWMSGLGEITDSTGTSIIIEETGLYKVRVRNAGLCEAFSQEISVSVNAYPTTPLILSENYELNACQDEAPIVLSVETEDAGAIYQWSRNGVPISGAGSSILTGYLDEGDYTVEATSNNCNVESQSLTISYGEMPDKPTILAEGPSIWYLACSNDSATAYKWYLDGMLIEGAEDYLYVAGTQEGKFEVAISENGSCYAKSDPMWIPLRTGIELDPWENLKIYPNPTPGLFTLEMDNHLMGELTIDIFGETGSKIINIKFHKETSHFKTQIDLSGQPAAAYLIGLMLDKYKTNRTLIVE